MFCLCLRTHTGKYFQSRRLQALRVAPINKTWSGSKIRHPAPPAPPSHRGGWVDGATAGNTHLGMCRMSWHVHNKQVEHLTGYYEDEEEDEAAVKAEDEAQAEAADTVPAQVQEDEEKVKENETGREKMRQAENEFPA